MIEAREREREARFHLVAVVLVMDGEREGGVERRDQQSDFLGVFLSFFPQGKNDL